MNGNEIVTLLLGALIVIVLGVIIASAIGKGAKAEEKKCDAEKTSAEVKIEQIKADMRVDAERIRAELAKAKLDSEEKIAEAKAEADKKKAEADAQRYALLNKAIDKGQDDRLVLHKFSAVGDNLSFEQRLDPSKEALNTSLEIAKLCKGGRFSSPACGSLSWNDGPDSKLADKGLSKEPLYGNLRHKEEPNIVNVFTASVDQQSSAGARAAFAAETAIPTDPTHVATKSADEKSAPASEAKPAVAVAVPAAPAGPPQCAQEGCTHVVDQRPDGRGYYRFCRDHAPVGGRPAATPTIVDRSANPLSLPSKPAEKPSWMK